MPATILIGAQWGDEGKGRVVDWLASDADVVARFSGGDNAGHTVVVNNDVFKLHLIPSGILHSHVVSVMGNGMVINPVNLVSEMDKLIALGVDVSPERLLLSSKAHLISPSHIALDIAQEQARGDKKLGTTLRGIGPAYLDKTGRKGIRAGEMREIETFADALHASIQQTNRELVRDGFKTIDADESVQKYLDAAMRLRPYITDTTIYLNRRIKEGAKVVCEGAQGTLLDIDHGTYPYVTSSSPTVGGALSGLGFGPTKVDRVIGVAKAFSTRVGSGNMPTELDGALGDRLRGTGENFWDEFGTTTGRPRRCGWLDTVVLRYAAEINGFTEIVLTKLDILSGFDEVKIAVAYDLNGERLEYPPSTVEEMELITPIYETMLGWDADVTGLRRMEDLPENARNYVNRVAELCDTPIYTVSVGPERDQLVHA
ncbi:MAG TPA: adenylosuccinate synthase [Phototrophicaceae bacterium]|jgi:adenylosuccinate synthase|nr:adenylosuccinate synthase [Phototrophicaceae bacterium]